MEFLQAPNENQMKQIRDSLNEDPMRLEHTLKLFEEWIEHQHHLPKNYDRNMLPYFLRGCKHDFERAKKKWEKYFSIKNAFPEYYTERDPNTKDMLNVSRTVSTVVLPKMTPEGQRVYLFRLLDNDPAKFNMFETVKFISMMADLRMAKDHPHSGEIYIFDGKNFTGAHAVKLISAPFKSVLLVAKEAYPIRLIQVHIINAPMMVEKMLIFAKSFMHEKMRSRFQTHDSLESLYKFIPREILPVELGGEERNLQDIMNDWHQCFVKNTDWFQKQEKVTSTETIQAKNLYQSYDKNNFGVEGSFRRLAID